MHKQKVKNLYLFFDFSLTRSHCILFLIVLIFVTLSGCNKKTEEGPITIVREEGEREPAFSPDGKFLAYCAGGILLFEIATEESEYLTEGWSPNWSPDGKEIVYVYNQDIYKINIETKEIKQLTTWGSCFFPDWSPNGKLLAFDCTISHGGNLDSSGIWIMDLGSNSAYKRLGLGREPDWRPDCKRIVYEGRAAKPSQHEFDVWIVDTSGIDTLRLTDDGGRSPVFSPDGSKIAYVNETRNENNWSCYNIWVMDTIGNNKTQLTFEPEGKNWSGAFDPAWSPDGSKIVYARSERFVKKEGDATVYEYIWHLWIMDLDGENKRQLTGKVTKTFGCK